MFSPGFVCEFVCEFVTFVNKITKNTYGRILMKFPGYV